MITKLVILAVAGVICVVTGFFGVPVLGVIAAVALVAKSFE